MGYKAFEPKIAAFKYLKAGQDQHKLVTQKEESWQIYWNDWFFSAES